MKPSSQNFYLYKLKFYGINTILLIVFNKTDSAAQTKFFAVDT